MKRAYLIDMQIFRSYAITLLGSGFFVSLCVGAGMQTVAVVPAILTCMYFVMGAMGNAAYDDQNGWGRYRLTMPLSRRDIVLGRYAAIVTFGLTGAVVGFAASFALMGIATVIELPGGLSQALAFSPELLATTVSAAAFCVLVGSFVASVVSPMYFKFGQTKATQWLPAMIFLALYAPVVVLGASGALDTMVSTGVLAEALAFIETPAGLAIFVVAACVAALVLLGISAAVSLRLYATREL